MADLTTNNTVPVVTENELSKIACDVRAMKEACYLRGEVSFFDMSPVRHRGYHLLRYTCSNGTAIITMTCVSGFGMRDILCCLIITYPHIYGRRRGPSTMLKFAEVLQPTCKTMVNISYPLYMSSTKAAMAFPTSSTTSTLAIYHVEDRRNLLYADCNSAEMSANRSG